MSEDNLQPSWWLGSHDSEATERSTDLNERLRLRRLATLQTKARQACAEYLPIPGQGDPAMNILLVLYSAYAEQHTLNVTAVTSSSGVPVSTGIRWLDALAHKGLVRKEPAANDLRSFLVHLTDDGVVTMENLLRRQLQIFGKLCTA